MIVQQSLHRLLMLSVLAILCHPLLSTLERVTAQDATMIRIPAGETLEIMSDTVSRESEFSWILTKDRKFQTAQRQRFFQNRFAETGTYNLDVSIHDAASGENSYRAFSITVTDPVTADIPDDASMPEDEERRAVLTTDPPATQNTVHMQPTGGVLRLDPSESEGKIDSYTVDIDTSIDTDGDGDPANDSDTNGMLSEKIGSPLYLFVLPHQEERFIDLTVSALNDTAVSRTQLSVVFSGQDAETATVYQDPNSPISYTVDGMTVRAQAQFDPAQIEGTSLLLEWDFGDRSKSLLNRPSHTFSHAGTYTLSLVAKNIETGEIVYEGTTSVDIQETMQASSSSSASQETVQSSRATTTSSNSFRIGSLITVSLIVFLILLLAGGLYAILTWIKRRTTYSIQKTLEKVEESIVRKDAKADVLPSVTPVNMKKAEDDIVRKEKAATEFTTRERTQITPTTTAGPVPSWLQQSQSKPPTPPPPSPVSTKPTPRPPAPPPSPMPTPPPSAPIPSSPPRNVIDAIPATSTAQPTTTTKDNGPVPDWLKPTKPVATTPKAPASTPPVSQAPANTPPAAPDVKKAEAKAPEISPPSPQTPVSAPAPAPAQQTSEQKEDTRQITKSENSTKETVAPVTTKETPAPKPVSPTEKPLETSSQKNDEEPPIAIIQADSLMT